MGEVARVHQDCSRDDDFKRLEGLVAKVFDKMDTFIGEMRDVMISEARRQEQIASLANDFARTREKLQEIVDWKNKFEGGFKVMMAIPVVCTIITTCIAIYKMTGG